MRKLLVVTALLLVAGISFGQTSKTTTVDIEVEKKALNELMDKIDAGFENGDFSILISSLADDALICGTDPSEFWSTKQFLELIQQDPNNPAPDFKYIGDRNTKITPDGNSAIVVTQYIISWSPRIPWRHVYHFVKTNDNWMVYFMNIAFIPKNEDIQRLNEAIE